MPYFYLGYCLRALQICPLLSLLPSDSRAEPAAHLQLQTPCWEHLTRASSPPGAHKHAHFITPKLLGNSSNPFYKWRIREGQKQIQKIKIEIFMEAKQLDKQNFSISRSLQCSLCHGNLPFATLTWIPGGTGSACIDPMVSVVFHSSPLSRSFFFIWNLPIKKSLSHN